MELYVLFTLLSLHVHLLLEFSYAVFLQLSLYFIMTDIFSVKYPGMRFNIVDDPLLCFIVWCQH
jgi:hypothetical protein